ncbi:hypothetical protein KQI61_04270 [Anaerocolumna aminovalerica]|uniref:hypothetical protein n=1 Tax=Anaerocolumna aminovalerica TaxID=1527 RepID=UPI001C0F13D4|nr:hypothetical protein [Anaerocolumna aminovalerica]MBU5331403.1 hypothetical protein [Anaerocolumna aminovalerica]
MPSWKLCIFKRAVIVRHEAGEGTTDEIVATYTKLSTDEQQEVITAVNAELNSK